MATARPNPHRDPVPWNRVRIGGRLIKATLTEFSGMKIVDGWKVDKSKSSSGGAAKFTGTKILEDIKLTFKCVGIGPSLAAAEEAFDDLYDVYALLAPVPGQGGGTTATATTGQTAAVGSASSSVTAGNAAAAQAAAQAKASGATGSQQLDAAIAARSAAESSFTPAESSFGAGADKKAADPDPGPRPPTLPIEFAPCALLGVFAIARKSFEITYDNKDLSWSYILELIQDKPPTPAGAGVMAAPKPATAGGVPTGYIGPTAAEADAAKRAAQAEAAAT